MINLIFFPIYVAAMCEAGFVSKTGLKPCFACPAGSFQPHVGRSSCLLCPGNVNTNTRPATNVTHCEGKT